MLRRVITSFFAIAAAFAAAWAVAGCGGWTENRAVMKQAEENSDLTPALLRANIETTDYTAIVRIERGRVDGPPVFRRLGGYVNHIYQARVMETIRGPRFDMITFSVMAESDIDPILPEYPVIVSLCGSDRARLYVPDNGYELPASPSLAAAARAFSRGEGTTPARKRPVSVCTPAAGSGATGASVPPR